MKFWFEIITRRRRGFWAWVCFYICLCLSQLYRLVIAVRNYCYDSGIFAVMRAGLPVISIGNITAGGTGKTPLVIWLCGHLSKRGVCCAVLSRGYKGSGGDADEPALIREKCSEALVFIGSDRFKNALEASQNPKIKALVLDDGFQHRRLARDLNIITVDALNPFGYERLLPAGLLREPLSQIKRADAAVITRCDIAEQEQINFITWRLIKHNPEIVIARAGHKYNGIKMLDGTRLQMSEAVGKKCFVFCGIGNPDAFLQCLWNHNINFSDYKIYPDHHNYSAEDVNYLLTKAADYDIILATEKDLIKLGSFGQQQFKAKCGCTDFELEFLDGLPRLEELIENKLKAVKPD